MCYVCILWIYIANIHNIHIILFSQSATSANQNSIHQFELQFVSIDLINIWNEIDQIENMLYRLLPWFPCRMVSMTPNITLSDVSLNWFLAALLRFSAMNANQNVDMSWLPSDRNNDIHTCTLGYFRISHNYTEIPKFSSFCAFMQRQTTVPGRFAGNKVFSA